MAWTLEDKLLIACCREALGVSGYHDDFPETEEINREIFFQMAKKEGVSQLVYHAIKKNSQVLHTSMPETVLKELEKEYYTTAARNTFLLTELGKMAKAFAEAAITVIILKGAHLAEYVYENPALRSMSDIDLLIKDHDLPAIDRIFNSRGYSSQDIKTVDQNALPTNYLTTVVYTSPEKQRPCFHIHWHFINSTLPNDDIIKGIDIETVWHDAIPVKISGTPISVMSPHHLLIHLAEHSLRVTHSLAKLSYLCDIAAVVKTYGKTIDWSRLVEHGKKFNIRLLLYFPLFYARELMGAEIPDKVLANLRPGRLGRLENTFIRLFENNHRFPGTSYLLHLAQNPSLSSRIKFVLRTLLPPRHVVGQRFAIAPEKVNVFCYFKRFLEVLLSGGRMLISLLRSEKIK